MVSRLRRTNEIVFSEGGKQLLGKNLLFDFCHVREVGNRLKLFFFLLQIV